MTNRRKLVQMVEVAGTPHSGITFGVRVPPCDRLDRVADTVVRAEQAGFDTAWVADSQLLWRDVYAALAVAAVRTQQITLATAVTNFRTRHPTVVASAINTISELAPGRVVLGVGSGDSSVKTIGMRPSRLAEMRDAVNLTRRLLDGDFDAFDGRKSRLKDAQGRVAVHLAASGPRTLEMAGELADGVVTLAGISPETLEETRDAVSRGAQRAGRSMDDIDFLVGAFCRVTDDIERDARILKPICLHMASIGGQDYLRLAGIELQAPPKVPFVYPDMVHAEDWDAAVTEAAEYVTDDMAVKFAQTFCLFGSVTEIMDRIDRAVACGATGFYLRHVGSYSFPTELIDEFGESVLSVAHKAQVPGAVS